METSAVGDLRGALNVAGIAAECTSMVDVQEQLLPALVRLVGAHLAIYHEAGLAAFHSEYTQVDLVWPDPRAVATAMVNFGAVAADAPVIAHFAKRPTSPTVVLRQLVSRREWHASPAYDTSLRLLGIEDQVARVLYNLVVCLQIIP